MKNSKRKQLREMERQDALGISRKKSSRAVMTVRTFQILRLCLVIATPLVYFLCSPFLILLLFAWIGLLFISRSIEKKYNEGLKKELQTKLPKTDSVLCIVLVAIVLISVLVSSVSTTSKGSMFEGMTDSELEDVVDDFKFDDSKFIGMKIVSTLKDIGSLTTGTRWLFQSERSFRGGPGGGFPSGMEGMSPPADFTPPSGKPDMGDMLSNMPFTMVFQSIMQAVCTGGLVIICLVAILSIRKIKKLNIDDRELSEKEKLRRMKREEARLKKEAEGKNYISMQKADFSALEQEILSDLAFLFDLENEETEPTEEG